MASSCYLDYSSIHNNNIELIHDYVNSSPPNAAYMSVTRVNIGSDNGSSPIRRHAIILTSAGLLSIGPLGTNSSEIIINVQNVSFTKMFLKISSAKWRPFCLGRDELRWQRWHEGVSYDDHKDIVYIYDIACPNVYPNDIASFREPLEVIKCIYASIHWVIIASGNGLRLLGAKP